MQRVWNWLKSLRVVEYRLCEEDRERIDSLLFTYAAMTDEFQALGLELDVARKTLDVIARTIQENNGVQARKERAHRRTNDPHNTGSGQGKV